MCVFLGCIMNHFVPCKNRLHPPVNGTGEVLQSGRSSLVSEQGLVCSGLK